MKVKSSYKKNIIILIVVFLAFSMLPINASEKKVIRVGYVFMDGLSMKDTGGNYYGYDYDYLMQISQYTGWDFEFVEMKGNLNERLIKSMEMLEKGEIDLLGGLKYAESLAEKYDYASEPYGNAYNVITVKDDSELIDVDSLINKKNLKIAIQKSAGKKEALLIRFAEMNGIQYEKIEVESPERLDSAVNEGRADAFLSVDLSISDGFHSIARFSPDPFYFVTTKGNTQIINDLNNALTNINKINPTFSSTTYERYFGLSSDSFVLNSSEKAFVRDKKEIKVLIHDGAGPIQYLKDGTAAGIGTELLSKLSSKTGLKIKYIFAKNNDDFTKQVKNKEVDLILGLAHEAVTSDLLDVTLSDPYISTNTLLVVNKKNNPTKLDELCEATTMYNSSHRDIRSCGEIEYYDNLETALLAVEDNKSDFVYVNSYIYTFYMNKYEFNNLSTFATSDNMRSQYSFAVPKSDNLTLLSILNKSIRSQKGDLESYIFKNAYADSRFDLKSWMKEHVLVVLLIILFAAVIVVYLIRRYYNNQLEMKNAIELEYMRYQMLSDISGEISFSYDYKHSELKVSNSGVGKVSKVPLIKQFRDIKSSDEEYPAIIHDIYNCLNDRTDCSYEIETTMLDQNEKHWYQILIKVIKSMDKGKEVAVYAVGKIVSIQKEKEEKKLLLQKSRIDILTGIYNRGAAQDLISEALASEEGLGALIMLDLDNFKDVNDTYGHLEGDQVLVETAQLLTKLYDQHIVARLGGDEFVIYVSDTSKEKIVQYCEATLEEIHHLPSLRNSEFVLSLSMGVVFTSCSKDYMSLMKRADEKLYEAKRSGRNEYHIL